MVSIKNEADLLSWLNDQPDAVARVIGTRAALSALPYLASYVAGDPKTRATAIVLPCFRAVAPPWFAGTWPNQGGGDLDAARAAARDAAGAAARAAARAAAWARVQMDANSIDAGYSASDLANEPLMRTRRSKRFDAAWSELKDMLLGLDQDWHVWTDWYEDRLAGAAMGRRLIPELELDRILVPDFDAPAAEVNATIAALEKQYREPPQEEAALEPPPDPDTPTTIPDQPPAVIEVTLGDDGLLHRAPPRGLGEGNAGREEVLRQAWQAHRAHLDALMALDPGRNWPALQSALAAYDQAMGTAYDSFRVIELGFHGLRIISLAERSDEFLMADGAAELQSFAMAHGLHINQFDEWTDYLAKGRGKPPPGAVRAAESFLRQTVDHPEIIAEDITPAAMMIAEAVAPENQLAADETESTVKAEAINSTGNILAGAAAGYLKDLAGGARSGSIKGVEAGTKLGTQALVLLGLKEVA